MNLNKISAAVTAALTGLVASTAFALPASQYNSTPGDTLDVFVGGASAQDNALERLFRNACDVGTLDIFRTTNQRVLFCRISNAGVAGFPVAGQKVAIHKTSVGGSGNGVQPVANQTNLAFIDMNAVKAGTITCSAATSVAAETVAGVTFAGYTNNNNCGSVGTRNAVPDAGISDVEPALVGASATEIANLDVSSQNAVVFGIPVTEALRNALQEVQGLTVGAEDEANMPSLTYAQLSSIYNGGIADWSQIVSSNGTDLPSAVTTAPSDTQVYLCRRVSTSGTQASFEVHMLRQRCVAGVAGMLSGNDGGVVGAGTVNEGSGTGNVISCLNTHDQNNRWAVGLFSTENVETNAVAGVNDGNVWRFIKMNGHAPTLLNVANGKYDFFTEQSIQWRNSTSGNALSGLKLTLMNDIKVNAGSPSIIRALNNGFIHSWGDAGVMALITNGHMPTTPVAGTPLTASDVRANPVLTSTRSPQGAPNNCQPPVTYFPVDGSTAF
ncbi:MAG: hypothetical protein HY941_10140 [Gammaproteobacteria bacterium]|nr:hypothetical protein [Gammaproteobacteria bacterium]